MALMRGKPVVPVFTKFVAMRQSTELANRVVFSTSTIRRGQGCCSE